MRIHRIALFAGWMLVSLLAVAGFAAFSASGSAAGETVVRNTTLSSDVGRDAGSVAALTFSYLSDDGLGAAAPPVDLDAAVAAAVAAARERRAEETARVPVPETTAPTAASPATRPAPAPTTTVTAPATLPTPPSLTGYLTEAEVRDLVAQFFAPEDVSRAVRIAWCESNFNPSAVNPRTGAAGLFQHIPRYWAERSAAAGIGGADIFDPVANVAVAAWLLYQDPGGWDHWSCRA